PADGGNVDAIAGATQTSTFVINMLNEDITEFIKSKGGM
ncbi:MAG: NADH:quinone oxidoreductase, partial [Gallicola sp.]|nr:NADH:quinone oxidoreductase [Gallicola sp.]